MCGLEALCSRTVQFIVSLFLEDTQTLEFLKTVMMIIIERCIVAKKKKYQHTCCHSWSTVLRQLKIAHSDIEVEVNIKHVAIAIYLFTQCI